MKLNIIKIGNSSGIRIPKTILKQCGFTDKVHVTVKNGNLIISADSNPREGWDKDFKLMAKRGDDKLIYPEISSLESDKDWEW